MIYILSALNVLLMMAMPILLCLFLARRFGVGWKLAGIGALTFIGSQVVHIPLLLGLTALFQAGVIPELPSEWKLLTNAIILGLAAGLCEEPARYLVYRWWLKSARSWKEALMFGAGHGGIEAIFLGAYAGLTVVQLYFLSQTDLSTLPLTPEQLAAAQQQLDQFLNAPWYAYLLGALERSFTLFFHVAATVLVLQAVTRKNVLWLAAAVVWHTVVDAVAVYAVSTLGVYWTEAIVGALTVPLALGIIWLFRDSGPGAATVPEVLPADVPDTVK